MKITKQQLKQIIKEEVSKIVNENESRKGSRVLGHAPKTWPR